jgi:predicted hydrocarbon binding protein
MIKIEDKTEHDPVADLYVTDAYMRWALLAAAEVVGKRGLAVVLREAGLERFLDNYPAEQVTKPSGQITFRDYAALNAGLFSFFGRAGKSMVLRIGRLSTQRAIKQQGELFGLAAVIASKVLPIPTQLKMGLETMQGGFRKISQSVGQDLRLRVQDRGDKLAYVTEDCPMCAGKQASEPMCWLWVGTLGEATHWQTGREFEIVEVECRATGAPACVWEISKQPKG